MLLYDNVNTVKGEKVLRKRGGGEATIQRPSLKGDHQDGQEGAELNKDSFMGVA